MSQLSIIIPVWNLWEMTKACLESIAKVCAKDGLLESIEVIVVDNNSTDATCSELPHTLKKLFESRGHVLSMPDNMGFAKACNAGAKAAKSPLLFFLNNDTILMDGCLPPLLEALDNNPKLGMVAPLLLYPNNTIQHAGICFSPTLELTHAYHLLPADYVKTLKQRFWQAITGAALLMPAKVFLECDGFHESYVNGFEDIDLCCQVREKGYLLNVIHESTLYHLTSQTPGRFDYDDANAALLSRRCQGAFRPDQHKVALEAGFVPLLSPDLWLYTALPTAKEQAMTHMFSENFEEQRCKARLKQNPYWLGGYELLAKNYETKGMWQEALDVRTQVTQLAPLAHNYASMAFCAAHLQKIDIVKHAQHCLKDIINTLKNKEELLHKAMRLQTWAKHNNDPELEHIFSNWLKEHA